MIFIIGSKRAGAGKTIAYTAAFKSNLGKTLLTAIHNGNFRIV